MKLSNSQQCKKTGTRAAPNTQPFWIDKNLGQVNFLSLTFLFCKIGIKLSHHNWWELNEIIFTPPNAMTVSYVGMQSLFMLPSFFTHRLPKLTSTQPSTQVCPQLGSSLTFNFTSCFSPNKSSALSRTISIHHFPLIWRSCLKPFFCPQYLPVLAAPPPLASHTLAAPFSACVITKASPTYGGQPEGLPSGLSAMWVPYPSSQAVSAHTCPTHCGSSTQ